MKKYGFKGTIFVVTGFLGVYDNYLTWDQARELSDNGFSIESHTHSHKSMTEASDEEISRELTRSREKIKEKLGLEADFIAYPTGTYNLHIADLVRQAGKQCLCAGAGAGLSYGKDQQGFSGAHPVPAAGL